MENSAPSMPNKPYINHGVKWGIINGLITLVIFYVLYFTNMRLIFSSGWWIGILMTLILLVIQGLDARKIDGGHLPYSKAFATLFFASLVISVIHPVANHVIKNYVISAETLEQEKMLAMESAAKWMENFGAPQDKIDEALERMEEEEYKQTLGKTIGAFFGSVIIYTLLSLLLALFVKRKSKQAVPHIESETT